MSAKEYKIYPLYCVSLPGHTYQCGLKYTNYKHQTLQDEETILLLEKNIRGDISSVMANRGVIFKLQKKIFHIDANNLYDWALSQTLPRDETKIDKNVTLKDILNTSNDSPFGYLLEVHLENPDEIKQKTLNFPFDSFKKNTH